jgi:AcrR family transcriptional regulator
MAANITAAVTSDRVDGRVARGARNRDRIVEAAVHLVRAGDLQPTAERIAEQANVGVRSVFRHFDDLDGLFRAISEKVEDEVAPLADSSPIHGELIERIAELVRRRVKVYERVAPFRQSARVHRKKSVAIRIGHGHLDRWHRCQLEETLAPELKGAPSELIEVLDSMASFETWDRLRNDQRLSRERANEVVRFALHNVLLGLAKRA